MSESTGLPSSNDLLRLFIGELLSCGGVLSQIVTQMVRFDAATEPDPDAVPIPVAAHELLSSALGSLKHRYSRRDRKGAARILKGGQRHDL